MEDEKIVKITNIIMDLGADLEIEINGYIFVVYWGPKTDVSIGCDLKRSLENHAIHIMYEPELERFLKAFEEAKILLKDKIKMLSKSAMDIENILGIENIGENNGRD